MRVVIYFLTFFFIYYLVIYWRGGAGKSSGHHETTWSHFIRVDDFIFRWSVFWEKPAYSNAKGVSENSTLPTWFRCSCVLFRDWITGIWKTYHTFEKTFSIYQRQKNKKKHADRVLRTMIFVGKSSNFQDTWKFNMISSTFHILLCYLKKNVKLFNFTFLAK